MSEKYERLAEAKLARELMEAKQEIERLTLALNQSETECGHLSADLGEAREMIEQLEKLVIQLGGTP